MVAAAGCHPLPQGLCYYSNFQIAPHLLQEADLAICDLTITYERRQAVDFTMPFMTLGEYFALLKLSHRDLFNPHIFFFFLEQSVSSLYNIAGY